MRKTEKLCKECGKPGTPRAPLSGKLLHRKCAITRAAEAAAKSFDLAKEITIDKGKPGQDTLEAGIERSVRYIQGRIAIR